MKKTLKLNKISVLFAVLLTCLLLETPAVYTFRGRGAALLVGASIGNSNANKRSNAYYEGREDAKRQRDDSQSNKDRIRELEEENKRLKAQQ